MRKAFILILLSGTTQVVCAQNSPGSPYTYFAIGDIYQKGSGHHLIKGGTGIADRNAYTINNLNPASYNSIGYPYTFLNEFGFSLATATRDDGSDQGRQIELDFPYLTMAFKTGKKSGSVFGLRKYSNVNYDIVGFEDFNGIPGRYRIRYEGSGGLNEAYFGYGRWIGKRLSVGAHFSYIFGSIQNHQLVNSSDVNFNVSIEDDNFLRTLNVDFGVQYILPVKKSSLTFGLTYDPGNNLKSSRDLEVLETLPGSDVPVDILSTSELDEDDYILPHVIGAGISWNKDNKYSISLDAQTQLWSESSLSGQDFSLRDSRRASIGFEKLPDFRSERYIDHISWGFGAYAEQSYLVLENEGLNNTGITLGCTLPVGSRGMIRLIGERGARGESISDFFSESYTKFTINVTFMDLWFTQRKFH